MWDALFNFGVHNKTFGRRPKHKYFLVVYGWIKINLYFVVEPPAGLEN